MKAKNDFKFGFSKSERITSKKLISSLFKEGKSIFLYPLLIKYQLQDKADEQTNHQVLLSVSSKKIKRAVDRNLVKRRMKESYRLNKHLLEDSPPLFIAIIYISKNLLTFGEIEVKLKEGMGRLKSHKY